MTRGELTQWFNGDQQAPRMVGWYQTKIGSSVRVRMRYWNGEVWSWPVIPGAQCEITAKSKKTQHSLWMIQWRGLKEEWKE